MKPDLQTPSISSSATPRNVPYRLTKGTLASTQRQSRSRPESLAFYAALNDLQHDATLPHPILARNAGLLPAWRNWAEQNDDPACRALAEHISIGVRHRYALTNAVLDQAIQTDPVWMEGTLSRPAFPNALSSFCTASLMYW